MSAAVTLPARSLWTSETATACRSMFRAAIRNASALTSAATTFAPGQALATAIAIAPQPVPTSSTVAPGQRASSATPISTSNSVSGRGMSVPGPTRNSSP